MKQVNTVSVYSVEGTEAPGRNTERLTPCPWTGQFNLTQGLHPPDIPRHSPQSGTA